MYDDTDKEIEWIKRRVHHLNEMIEFHREKLKYLHERLTELTGQKTDKVKEENSG